MSGEHCRSCVVGLGEKKKAAVFVLTPLLPEAINIYQRKATTTYYTIHDAIVNPGMNYFLSLQIFVYRYIYLYRWYRKERKRIITR